MSALSLYFLVMLDNIDNFFIIVTSVLAVAIFICIAFPTMENNRLTEFSKKVIKIWVPILGILTFITIMIPSTKQVAFIYIVSNLSQNKIVQDIGEKSLQIPDKALEILNMKMNEYIDDMKKEAVDEAKKAVKN